MGEAVISRASGVIVGVQLPAVVPGYCGILTTVKDSNGVAIRDICVNCKDGDSWYNYTTNEKGQVLFMTNSGSANITAWNFTNSYRYIDQAAVNVNIDAPVTTSKLCNIQLNKINGYIKYFSVSSDAMQSNITVAYSGNCKFRVTDYITNVNIFGGGGGGSMAAGSSYSWESGGGGGGYVNSSSRININKNSNYTFIIGSGGRGGWYNNSASTKWKWEGSAGGSSSAFGLSAAGGAGAAQGNTGGAGGTGKGKSAYNHIGANSSYNYGGGGGAGITPTGDVPTAAENMYRTGGTPYGGMGGYRKNSTSGGYATSGTKAGGGGGASITKANAGNGGAGVIEFTIP